jgi:hypothetical protein
LSINIISDNSAAENANIPKLRGQRYNKFENTEYLKRDWEGFIGFLGNGRMELGIRSLNLELRMRFLD